MTKPVPRWIKTMETWLNKKLVDNSDGTYLVKLHKGTVRSVAHYTEPKIVLDKDWQDLA
jgi:rRNA pseudouridine-1189 N-methylase Emg1 (Nep1/Mra1 family)